MQCTTALNLLFRQSCRLQARVSQLLQADLAARSIVGRDWVITKKVLTDGSLGVAEHQVYRCSKPSYNGFHTRNEE